MSGAKRWLAKRWFKPWPFKSLTLERRSLFAEILDWMLAPLLLVWPLTIILTYGVAEGLSQQPFDRVLEDQVHALARQVRWDGDVSYVNLPSAARNILRADDTDQIFFQVRTPKNRLLAGDPDLTLPDEEESKRLDSVQFRSEELADKKIRIAHMWIAPLDGERSMTTWVLVQVAETLGKRTQLATEIIKGMILPQFIVLPISVLLVWFGLSRGIRPLNTLQQRIQARSPEDLSPIALNEVPEELAPVLVSFNNLLLRLEHNLQVQKRFVADAAHQLKTPLAGLRLQAELAQSAANAAERDKSLDNISRGSRQATRLVNQLLALARTEAQSMQGATGIRSLPMVLLDLSDLVREVAVDWVDDAVAQGHDLGLEAEASAWIMGNPVLLKEMVKNLIDNALTYTPAPGLITLRVAVTGQAQEHILLEIEDTGPGIPAEEREAVLQPFYRVLGTGKDGSGLGLAIVQHTAVQHGASIALLDNPRAGHSSAAQHTEPSNTSNAALAQTAPPANSAAGLLVQLRFKAARDRKLSSTAFDLAQHR
jgi:two-component system, OmpR family, sensor histidine kinase TctE